MSEKLMTEFRSEGGKIVSLFENHPPIDVTGMSKAKDIPEAWSPPHMLVAAAESCFYLTLSALAEKMRIGIKSYSSTAEGIVTSSDGKHYMINEIILRPTFHLDNEEDRLRLKLLVEKAKDYCLVAQSLKTAVRVEL